jgi:DNA-binding ferritin-like protein
MDHIELIKRWGINKDKAQKAAIDKFLGIKLAADSMDDESCKLINSYVSMLRAMYLLHQQNHWNAQSYGDHLLFQRIYESSSEMADAASERAIGLCGSNMVEFENEEAIAKKFAPRIKTLYSLLESSLAIEKAFQSLAEDVYNTIKEKNMLTLGLDDLIMSQASESEVHIYLLQQAMNGYGSMLGSKHWKDPELADNAKEILEATNEEEPEEKPEAEEPKETEASSEEDQIIVTAGDSKVKYIIDYIAATIRIEKYQEAAEYIKSLKGNIFNAVVNGLVKRIKPDEFKKLLMNVVREPEVAIEVSAPAIVPDIPKELIKEIVGVE